MVSILLYERQMSDKYKKLTVCSVVANLVSEAIVAIDIK